MVHVAQAQQKATVIQGVVASKATGEVLDGATVRLLHLKDSVVARSIQNRKTNFTFQNIPSGQYRLHISFAGYRDTSFQLEIPGDTLINLDTVWLKPAGDLMEVVVRTTIPPVIVKNDTVVYNTTAYKTLPNATVEELLKRLPGMEVDKDGNITFQGQKVEKIYVDGKEFFLNDPRLASRNLLADMVQKVEAFDTKSERAKLTGIPDANPGKSINLRLKPDKKKGIFGTAQAAYAGDKRYDSRITANYFKGDQYILLTGGTSNGGNILNGAGGLPDSRTANLALNYSNRWNEKVMLSGSYALSSNSNKSRTMSHRETFLEDSSLVQDQQSVASGRSRNHSFGLSLNYAIDSFSTLTATGSLSLNQNENDNNNIAASAIETQGALNPANTAITLSNNNNHAANGNINIQYGRRFKKAGRFFSIGLSNNYNRSVGKGMLRSRTDFFDNGIVADSLIRDQQSSQQNKGSGLGLTLTYTEPIAKGQVFDFGYTLGSGSGNADQRTLNYNYITGLYDEPDSLATNAFNNRNGTQQFSLGYNYFKEKLRYQIGLSVARSFQDNRNLSGNLNNIDQRATNIFPRASLQYNISKQKYLQLNYNGSNHQPAIDQLQPVPDYSNPLLVRLGNPDLKQEFASNVNVQYRSFSTAKTSSFMWQVQYSSVSNQIVNATRTTEQGVQEQQYVNVNGNFNLGTYVSYGLPIGKGNSKGNVNLVTRLQYAQDNSFLNGLLNLRKSYQLGQQAQLNYHSGEMFFASLQASLNWNRALYAVQTNADATFLSQQYSTDLTWRFCGAWVLDTRLNLSLQGSQTNLPSQNIAVWNAGLARELWKDRRAQLKLSVYDILNDASSFGQTTGDNYIETTEMEVLKRLFVLSFYYRFRVNKI